MSVPSSSRATVVLVHGAWHGAWCWDRVLPLLTDAGIEAIAVDLPGHGKSTEPLGDLHTHSAFLRDTVRGVEGRVVLIGHSYGGAVISEAAVGLDQVQHLVYLCAVVPDAGEAVGSVMPGEVRPEGGASELGAAMQFNDDGTLTLDAPAAIPALFGDCTPDDVEFALSHLGPHSAGSLGQPLDAAAWREIESTYVVCTGDRAINPIFQRAMADARATHVIEWDTSHSPFFSRPDLVAELLVTPAE